MKILCIIFLFLTACTPGLLYTDIKEPLFTNMNETPYGITQSAGSSYEIKEPFTAIGARIEVASNAPGDIVKKSNMNKIYYADLHTRSYLLGLWRKRTVIVYGE